MATNFPTSLDSYSTKAAGNTIAEGHVNDPQDAIEIIEQKLGIGASGTIAQSASTNTALLGYGASLTGYATVSLENRSLVTGTLPASAVAIGGQVQVVNTQTAAVVTTTDTIVWDDSIPNTTDLTDDFMTLAITPTSATNKLLIEIVASLDTSTNDLITAGLFQDSTANAIAAANIQQGGANTPVMLNFKWYMAAGTTSATTFKLRAGGQGGTTTFNGSAGGRKLGGVMASSITITEIKV